MTEKGNECTEGGVGTGSGRFRSLEIMNLAVCEPIGEREVCSHGCVARDTGGEPSRDRKPRRGRRVLRRGSREVQIVRDRELGHLRANRRKGSVFPRVHRMGCGRGAKKGLTGRPRRGTRVLGGGGRFRSRADRFGAWVLVQ